MVKNPLYNAGDMGSITGRGTRIPHATEQPSLAQGLTHGAPTLIHTNPQHLNDVVVSRDHRIQYRDCFSWEISLFSAQQILAL